MHVKLKGLQSLAKKLDRDLHSGGHLSMEEVDKLGGIETLRETARQEGYEVLELEFEEAKGSIPEGLDEAIKGVQDTMGECIFHVMEMYPETQPACEGAPTSQRCKKALLIYKYGEEKISKY